MPNQGTNQDVQQFFAAVIAGNIEQASALLTNNNVSANDVLVVESNGFPSQTTALMIATANADAKMVELLLAHNAQVDAVNSDKKHVFNYLFQARQVTTEVSTALDQIALALLDAVKVESAKQMLEFDAVKVTESPAVLYATELGMLYTVIKLIRMFEVNPGLVHTPLMPIINDLDFTDEGLTPLEAAVIHKQYSLIRLFIKGVHDNTHETKNADPNQYVTKIKLNVCKQQPVEQGLLELAIDAGVDVELYDYLRSKCTKANNLELFIYATDNCTSPALFHHIAKQLTKNERQTISLDYLLKILGRRTNVLVNGYKNSILSNDNNTIARVMLRVLTADKFADNAVAEIIFAAVYAQAKFMEEVLATMNSFRKDPDFAKKLLTNQKNSLTAIQYAINCGRLATLPVMLKHGAVLPNISEQDLTYRHFDFVFPDPNNPRPAITIAAVGTLLQFAVLGRHEQLINSILAQRFLSPAEVQSQLNTVIVNQQTVYEFIQQHAPFYADVLKLLPVLAAPQPIATKEFDRYEPELGSLPGLEPGSPNTPPEPTKYADPAKSRRGGASTPTLLLFGSCFGSPGSSATSTRASTPTDSQRWLQRTTPVNLPERDTSNASTEGQAGLYRLSSR